MQILGSDSFCFALWCFVFTNTTDSEFYKKNEFQVIAIKLFEASINAYQSKCFFFLNYQRAQYSVVSYIATYRRVYDTKHIELAVNVRFTFTNKINKFLYDIKGSYSTVARHCNVTPFMYEAMGIVLEIKL